MILSVLPCFFLLPLLLLLHLVSSHQLPVPSRGHIRAQGPGSGGRYVKVSRTVIKQVLNTYGTAFNCNLIFRTLGFNSYSSCFPLMKESRWNTDISLKKHILQVTPWWEWCWKKPEKTIKHPRMKGQKRKKLIGIKDKKVMVSMAIKTSRHQPWTARSRGSPTEGKRAKRRNSKQLTQKFFSNTKHKNKK